jgi:hypothetical protein
LKNRLVLSCVRRSASGGRYCARGEFYTFIDIDANDLLKPFHDRMPVILLREDYEARRRSRGQGAAGDDSATSLEVSICFDNLDRIFPVSAALKARAVEV